MFQSFKYIYYLSHIPFLYLLLFSIRSPGPVTPRDVECEGFDVTYTRIASDKMAAPSPHSNLENDVDKKVDDAISSFLLSLSQIGPELLSVSPLKKSCFFSGLDIHSRVSCLPLFLSRVV
jgi:hypothetical protein